MWNQINNWIDNWFDINNTKINIKLHNFSLTNINTINHINLVVNRSIKFNINNNYTNLTIINKNKLLNYTINNNSNLNKINVN